MAFSDLHSGLQDIVMFNFETTAKYILIFLLILFSYSYKYYFKDKEKNTIFLPVAMLRLFKDKISKTVIMFTPLLLFLLYPQYSLDNIWMIMFTYLSPVVGFALLLVVVDIFNLGVPAMLVMAGMDTNNKKVKELVRKFKGRKLF